MIRSSIKSDKVLITQSQMKNYSGSEIVTLELIEYLSGAGMQVTLLTNYVGEPISRELSSIKGLRIILGGTPEASELVNTKFGLIWVHHLTLSPGLLTLLNDQPVNKRPYVVFHHMSYIEPLEFPLFFDTERSMANLVLFNSPETREKYEQQGIDFGKKAAVFGNPAPDLFYKNKKSLDVKKAPRRIAIVSNHPPDELVEASEQLAEQGARVDLLGRVNNGVSVRVTPKLLQKYDAVLSIGKTVQYCLMQNIPVYCYDRFGGPGYINSDNYDLAKHNNFSGRGFNTKTAGKITQEIINDYDKAVVVQSEIHQKHAKDFLLSSQLEKAIGKAANNAHEKVEQGDLAAFAAYASLQSRILPGYLRNVYDKQALEDAYKDKIDEIRQLAEKRQARIVKLENELEQIKASKIWRLRSATIPLIRRRKQ